jgi:hypothetical protein
MKNMKRCCESVFVLKLLSCDWNILKLVAHNKWYLCMIFLNVLWQNKQIEVQELIFGYLEIKHSMGEI